MQIDYTVMREYEIVELNPFGTRTVYAFRNKRTGTGDGWYKTRKFALQELKREVRRVTRRYGEFVA
jgi:hypothetical protein